MTRFRRDAAADRGPSIDFDYEQHVLALRGESWAEDVMSYFGPMFASLEEYLRDLRGQSVRAEVDLIYFNSSSAKALMRFFEMLDDAAARQNDVVVRWYHRADDDTIKEFGQEFAEDVKHARFEVCETDAASPDGNLRRRL